MTVQISPTELKAQLVSFAREIGFDSCRIAACGEPAHATEFREWLREGAHGEMNYMERGEEKRCDPQQVLPGARSIIVLALNYFQGEQAARRSETAATATNVREKSPKFRQRISRWQDSRAQSGHSEISR